jgi:glycosyltransferase involved in cell wall biosynthesis
MKIVLDLQAAQCRSRSSDIRRYILAFSKAVTRASGAHQILITLNGCFPDSADEIKAEFAGLLPRNQIRVFDLPGPLASENAANVWRSKAAEYLREHFLASLQPDVVHVFAGFDGWENDFVASIGKLTETVPVTVSLLELNCDSCTDPPPRAQFRDQRVCLFQDADLIFTVSSAARNNAIEALRLEPERVFVVPPAPDYLESDAPVELCGQQILKAFAQVHFHRTKDQPVQPLSRPTLAFVAPFPPERTGIAEYSARLVPRLEKYYDVVCVSDLKRIADGSISMRLPVRSVRWFEENGGRFDRILYQFGNSPAHKKMFQLLEQHPGVVVLHDFFLSDLLCWMAESGYAPGCFSRALYDSHGLSALVADNRSGRRTSVGNYPCNLALLRDSFGVIVHSEHAIELARDFYGDAASDKMRRVPFLMPSPVKWDGRPARQEKTGGTPVPRSLSLIRPDRAEARRRLKLPPDAFVVCSFGWVTPFKLCDRLLNAWITSPLGKTEETLLLFVGGTDEGLHGRNFRRQLSNAIGLGSRIELTGYVSDEQYWDYLTAADLAVQLRTQSRGETSATVFDCMAAGLPLIVNAHGSAAELPDEVVTKISDDFTESELAEVLSKLRNDLELRRQIGAKSQYYLNEVHRPELVARRYFDVIEEFNATSPRAQEQKLIKKIAHALAPVDPESSDFAQVARALAVNRSPIGLSQILVDITNITKLDLRTGIERVTRGILMSLIDNPPKGYRIEPVRASADGYFYARRFIAEALEFKSNELADDPVETSYNDLFLGVDWPADVLPSLKGWFRAQQRHGLQTLFVVYDLLPLLRPELFPPELSPMTSGWLHAVTEIADGVACISRTVADQLCDWLQKTNPSRARRLPIGFFRLGADLRSSLPTGGLHEDTPAILAGFRSRPTFLMVGTVEPRKGYRLALAAMELLWSDQIDVNLVIIGKKGWMMEDFAERVRQHPEHDRRLFWYQGVSDEMLEQVYAGSSALLAASEGEGFGLPLIEAARHGVPIVARDIPIFREVASGHAYFFDGSDETGLANGIREWLTLGDAAPSSAGLRAFTWQESARDLLEVALNERWYRFWETQ